MVINQRHELVFGNPLTYRGYFFFELVNNVEERKSSVMVLHLSVIIVVPWGFSVATKKQLKRYQSKNIQAIRKKF